MFLLNFKLRLNSIYLKLKYKIKKFIKQAQLYLQKFYKNSFLFSLRRFKNSFSRNRAALNSWLQSLYNKLLQLFNSLKLNFQAKLLFKNLQLREKIKTKTSFLSWFTRKFQALNQYKFPQPQIKLKSFFQKKYRPIYFSLITTTLILSLAWWSYNFAFRDLPDPLELTKKRQIMTTRILDRNGNLLFRIYEDENRTLVPLSQIPQHMINATLAIEDKNFYQHHGFSVQGIFRALVNNLKKQELQGGSTITQQLIKNRLLSPDKTLQRKLRELILSILVESTYNKDQILTMYLNEVSYGGSTYGVEEAAWQYFNKPAKDLSLGESAMLAGLPAAPSAYTPFGPNPELSKRRQEEVLRRMVEDGHISLEEAYLAQQEELQLRKNVIDIKAPHFVMYVRKLLAEKFGEQSLQQGGLEVRTSLDLNLQQQTEAIVQEEVKKVESLNIKNGAALVSNPQTGEILAMVGSRDYFDFENDGQVNVTVRPRQPGSAIKPLTYSLAFERGYTPWSYIEDSPITYHIPGSKPYSPRNYDGRFHGRVTLRQALANSYNVPAVKLLASLGVANLVEKGQEMGISTWDDSNRFGLSLTLGAGEILMSDLSEVYGSLATGGYKIELDPFLEIRDHQGKVLYRNSCYDQPESCRQQSVLDPLAAYWITDILSDNQARSQTFGSYSLLYIPDQQVAVKTGTTNSMRDNWTIGYTSDRLISVWVGNNDNEPMSYVASGMTGASPIWNRVTRLLLRSDELHQFALPDNLVKVKICAPTNTLPCQGCPQVVEAIYRKGDEPQKACNGNYFVNKDDQPPSEPPGERSQIL